MIIDWPPPDSAHGRAKCPPNPQENTTKKRPSCAHPTAPKNEDAELATHPFRAPEVSSGLRREAAVTEKLSVTLCHPAQALQVQTPQEIARHTGALGLLHAAQAKASGRQEGLPQPLCGQHPHAGDQETKKGNQAGMEVVGHLGAEESRRGISCRGSQRALFCLQTTVLRSTS